jgi:membrane protein required for colicin V production
MLGIVFGIARGIAIVAVLVLLAGAPNLSRETWWQESTLIKNYFQDAAIWIRGFLPPDVAENFVFE